MKNAIKIIAGISILLNVFLIYMFIIKGNTAEKDTDNRIPIVMTEGNRDFVLAEMRGFLESVKMMNEGMLEENPSKIIEAGNKSGGSVIAHAPKGFIRTLPIGFKKLGFATHDIFDKIAKNAAKDFDKNTAQEELNILLNNCVSCHTTYKIKVTPN